MKKNKTEDVHCLYLTDEQIKKLDSGDFMPYGRFVCHIPSNPRMVILRSGGDYAIHDLFELFSNNVKNPLGIIRIKIQNE